MSLLGQMSKLPIYKYRVHLFIASAFFVVAIQKSRLAEEVGSLFLIIILFGLYSNAVYRSFRR